jgi:hypothetical protein
MHTQMHAQMHAQMNGQIQCGRMKSRSRAQGRAMKVMMVTSFLLISGTHRAEQIQTVISELRLLQCVEQHRCGNGCEGSPL